MDEKLGSLSKVAAVGEASHAFRPGDVIDGCRNMHFTFGCHKGGQTAGFWRKVLASASGTPILSRDIWSRVKTSLSDFYVEYELRFVPARIERKGEVMSELHQRIQDTFADAGVQIMSPNFESQPDAPILPRDWEDEKKEPK